MDISNQYPMTPSTGTSATSGTTTTAGAAAARNMTGAQDNQRSQLSVQDFLQIMAAEMKNQNPMGSESGGGSKTDYITQLAQFTTLDQMNSMAEGINQLNMLSQTALIGKQVKVHGDTEDVSGIVEKVKFYNAQVYLQVEGKDYPIGNLLEVEEER
jgi:flagellar basal-body rod modification protein FlgD